MSAFFTNAEISEDGSYIAVLLREHNGTISAMKILAEQLADEEPPPGFAGDTSAANSNGRIEDYNGHGTDQLN